MVPYHDESPTLLANNRREAGEFRNLIYSKWARTKLTKVFERFLGTVGPVAVIDIVDVDIISEDRVAHRILLFECTRYYRSPFFQSRVQYQRTLMSRRPIGAVTGAVCKGTIIPLGT